MYAFFNSALKLARNYIKQYFDDPKRNIGNLRTALNADRDYLDFKAEFLKVYYNNMTTSKFVNFYHPLVCLLRTTLYRDGFPSFFSRNTQLSKTAFDFNVKYQPTDNVDPVYPAEDLEFDIQDAYAGYNWELFFPLPFEMGSRLSQDH
jgi:hypothetical protein